MQLIGTPESEDGEAVAMDNEGNCFVAGLTRGNLEDGSSDSSRDIFLAKYDAEGTERFIVEFGGDDYDKPTDLALVGDGGLVISGSTKGGFGGVTVDSGRAAFAAKLDEEGQLQWVGIAGGDGLDAGDAVAVDNTGAVYLGGADQSTGSGPTSDGFLAKFSEDGQQQWFKAVGTDRSGEVNAIVIGANGDIHAVGRAMGGIGEQTSEGRNDGFVATFAPDGANTQTSLFGSTDDEEPAAATLDDSGTLLVTGTQKIRRDGDRQTRGFLMKVELAGDVGWTETFSAYGAGVEIASNDAIFVGGTANPARGDREARLLKFQ